MELLPPPEKSLTKTDILKGYREEVLDHDMAIKGLMSIGYSEDEAAYLLMLEDVGKG